MFMDSLQGLSCRKRRVIRRTMISFSCESSCPSGPCMSPFCRSSVERWVHEPSFGRRVPVARVHERRSFFTTFSPHPNFLPNTRLQMSKFKSCFPGMDSNQWFAKHCGLWLQISCWLNPKHRILDQMPILIFQRTGNRLGMHLEIAGADSSDSLAPTKLFIGSLDEPRLMVFLRCLLAGISWHLGWPRGQGVIMAV